MKRNKLKTSYEIVMEKLRFQSIESKVDYVIKQLGRKESNVWGRTQTYETNGIIFTASYSSWKWETHFIGNELRSSVGKKLLSEYPDNLRVEERSDGEIIDVYHTSNLGEEYDYHDAGKWEGILEKLYIATKKEERKSKGD